jgi:hypothetical protein
MLETASSAKFSNWTTDALKHEILTLTQNRDIDPFSKKMRLYKDALAPLVEELSRRNPFPNPTDQLPVVLGIWSPWWTTIPFQDIIPGRLRDQSYQIFHADGYYANIARYAPGSKSFLQKLLSFLVAYDLMVVQKFAVHEGEWLIQNVGIEQDFRPRSTPLRAEQAEAWFTAVVDAKYQTWANQAPPSLKNLDKNTAKKFEQIYLAKPRLEHLYIDHDFRLVKSQREAKQRPSYTIAVRHQMLDSLIQNP